MNHTELIDKLVRELSYRVGIVNLYDKDQQSIISEILTEWGEYDAKTRIMKLLNEADDTEGDDKDYVHLGAGIYVRKGDEDKDTAQKYKKDDTGSLKAISDAEYQKTKSAQGQDGEKAAADTPQNQQGGDEVGGEEPPQATALKGKGGEDYKSKLPKDDPASTKSDKSKGDGTTKNDITKISTELYGTENNGKLLQNSETSNLALQNGYNKGADYVAPGNAGSNFNENISNEGSLILEKYPNLSEEELSQLLFNRVKNTKLGKQQKGTTIESPSKGNRGSVPKTVPTNERDTYRSCIIAARSAKSKYDRANNGKKAAQSQVGFGGNTTQSVYGGTEADLNNLKSEIQSANKIYSYDSSTDMVYEIPKDVMEKWVAASGGGENAADTAVITKDENGNLIYDGWSDKKGFNDIQGNSTLNDDYTKSGQRVDSLVKSGKIDESTAQSAKAIIDDAKSKSDEIEANYKKAPLKEATYLKNYTGGERERLLNFLQSQEESYNKAGTENHVLNAMKHYKVDTHDELLDKLFEEANSGKMSNNRAKVITRVAESEKGYIKEKGEEIPPGLDTMKILSDARDAALDLQRETIDKLNGFEGKTKSGKPKRLGDLIGFQETVDFLHLDKIDTPKSNDDYNAILKRNTELVMAGVAVPPSSIKGCLGVDDLSDYEDNFEVVTEESVIKDSGTSKYTTGKVVYIYAISKGGNRKFIGEKRYRSKQGPTGKTSNTIQWSKEMQSCFDSK